MTGRPPSLILAASLLIPIGGAGLPVGGTLIGAAFSGGPVAGDVREAGVGIGVLIAGYALAAVIAGIGLLLLRRWAWTLSVLISSVGLVALGGALAGIGSLDSILVIGVAIWGLALGLLVAPATRNAARG